MLQILSHFDVFCNLQMNRLTAKWNCILRFTENKREHFGKSRLKEAMEITIHEQRAKKIAISHFTENKKGRSQVTKILLHGMKEN